MSSSKISLKYQRKNVTVHQGGLVILLIQKVWKKRVYKFCWWHEPHANREIFHSFFLSCWISYKILQFMFLNIALIELVYICSNLPLKFNFLNKHSWQRGPNPPVLSTPSFFKFCPPFDIAYTQTHTHTNTHSTLRGH